MKSPKFNDEGVDEHTFAPFVLVNALDTEYRDVRLSLAPGNGFMKSMAKGKAWGINT